MKKIKFLILSVLFASTFSCIVDTEDIITQEAVEGGVSVQLGANTIGKALGAPIDPLNLATTSLNFSDVSLNMQVIKRWAGEDIVKYEIYKSLNGGTEVKVKESATLPMSLTYTNISEFIAGTQVTAATALRVGDVFKFRTKVTNSAGASYFIHDGSDYTGTYSVTVSCASNLAGNYAVTTYNLTSGFIMNHGIEAVVSTGPGTYVTKTTGTWAVGSIAPNQGYNFQDICGTLTVPNQDLAQGYYSNDVFQIAAQQALSLVNGATGNFEVRYTITFAAGNRDYRSVYIKQ